MIILLTSPEYLAVAKLERTLLSYEKNCGAESLKNVVLVTNCWGRLTDVERKAKWELENYYVQEACSIGSKVHTVDSIRGIISRIIQNHTVTMPLLV